MEAITNYKIMITNYFDDIKEFIKEVFSKEIEEEGNILRIYEEDKLVYIDDIKKLAIDIANKYKDSIFELKGTIDTSASAGEYMNFKIEYRDNKLNIEYSNWYVEFYADEYEDYEEFCDEFDEDDEHKYTRKEFNAFKKDEYFRTDSGEGDIVKDIPLNNHEEIDIK